MTIRRAAISVLVSTTLALACLLAGCFAGEDAPNGAECQKNDDCESKHCISNVCRPAAKFGSPTAADAGAD